jgi:hypothetical protein
MVAQMQEGELAVSLAKNKEELWSGNNGYEREGERTVGLLVGAGKA